MTEGDRGDAPRAEPILRPHKPEPILRPLEHRSILSPESDVVTEAPAPPPVAPPVEPPPVAPPPPVEPPRPVEPPPVAPPPEAPPRARLRARAPILSDEEPVPITLGLVAERAARVVLCAGIFAVPLAFDPRTIDVFNLAKITAVWVTAVAAVGLTVAAAVLRGPVSIRRSRTLAVALALLAVTGLATALSTNRTLSVFGLYHRYGGLLSLVLYVVCAALVVALYSHRAGALVEVATAIVASSFAVAVYVLVQAANADPFHRLAATVPHRVGTLGNADVAGAFLAIALPFAVYLAAASRVTPARIAAAAAGLVVVVGLVVTRSGIALAAAVGGLIALVVFASAMPRLAKAAGVVVMVAGVALAPLVMSGSFGYRTDQWDAGWRMAVERPLLGFGPDTYYANYPRFRTPLDARTRELAIPDKPRNVFVEWAASAGFTGLLVFLVLVGSVVWLVAGRAAQLPRHLRLLGAAIGAALVAYLVQALFSVDLPPLAMTAWVVMGAAAALLEPSRSPSVKPLGNAPWRLAAAAAAVVVAGVAAWYGFRPLRADHAAWAADQQGAGWSEDAARLHAKAIRLNRREAAYRSLAAAYFERVIGLDGTPITSRQALLGAAALYKAAAALQPRNPFFALDVARVYARFGQRRAQYFVSADQWLRRAIDIDPLDPQVHAVRATVLSQWAARTKDSAIAANAQFELREAERLRSGG